MARGTEAQKRERALRGTKKEAGGNAPCDQRWIDEVRAELSEPDVTNRPAGFLYDVHYQWSGYAEEINPDFFEASRKYPNSPKCTGTAYIRDQTGMYIVDIDWQRLTRPCMALPRRGAKVCGAHGGNIPNVKAAAETALANAAEVVALRLIGLTDEEVEDKVRLGAANSVLDRVGIRGGSTPEVKAPGYQNVIDRMFSDDE